MAGDPLRLYLSRRNFGRTKEPVGKSQSGTGNRFVIHKHNATADHYDLRLELGPILKSWAVPRGPSLNPADKRLAVQTEDHPIEYLDFEDVIPAGEYGGGPMIVWDTGTWAPMDDPHAALAKGAFKFRLDGRKLTGGWMLTRLKPKPGEKSQNWLLFKEHDQAANPGIDILAERPESVKTGRLIEDLLAPPQTTSVKVTLRPGSLVGAKKSRLPERVAPALATSATLPPTGDQWLHEIKFDGYRTMAYIQGGVTKLLTRSGLDWTRRYGDLPEAFSALPCHEALIDGEVVAVDGSGLTSLAALQSALARRETQKLFFYAFDLLHLNGWDITGSPLQRRKSLLQKLIAAHPANAAAIQFSDHISGDSQALYERASEMGLEGVVSKRASSSYTPGRSPDWVKTKALKAGDFVVVGYTTSEAAEGLAALAVAERIDGDLAYRGKVGTGFDTATAQQLLARLEPLASGAEPVDGLPKAAVPVRPLVSVHVHYAALTSDKALRHAVFKGLREVELAPSLTSEHIRLVTDAHLAKIWVTNPTRRLFGRSGPTKLDIAVYYAAVGDFMLPHILGRPVSFFRCPGSNAKDCFYQRHPFVGMPNAVEAFETKNSEGETQTYVAVEGIDGYLALAQFGVVEFHVWGSLRKHVDRPDRIVFDLDPGEGIGWREVVEAAVHVRGELEKLNLVPFVKTSGGNGIHLVVPIVRKVGWKQVHQATADISSAIARTAPDVFTTVMGAQNRKLRIFIDYHRNARSATAVAPYSLRARSHAPVSTPLSWADLETIDGPEDLNYGSVPALVAKFGDPWGDINDFARDLPLNASLRK
jgi:bifunctional non-homologous end joining protein LigD